MLLKLRDKKEFCVACCEVDVGPSTDSKGKLSLAGECAGPVWVMENLESRDIYKFVFMASGTLWKFNLNHGKSQKLKIVQCMNK